ncbi:MAG: hypothetical protein KGS61_05220 [Verrucomicrobia bacterium]|nr:hypothetical protein [Verrucomicrobiota bacterium]
MKAYIVTTGILFGLVVLMHVLRMLLENHRLATDPLFLFLTVLAAGLCGWAWRLFRSLAPRS